MQACRVNSDGVCACQVMQLGASHADVATTMASTAGLLKALGKQSEAETVYRTVGFRPQTGTHPITYYIEILLPV